MRFQPLRKTKPKQKNVKKIEIVSASIANLVENKMIHDMKLLQGNHSAQYFVY